MSATDVTAVRLVAHVRDCNVCRPAFSFDTLCDHGQNLTIGARMHDRQRQLEGNDLVTLHEFMIADPSIPSPWKRINRATGEIETVTEGQIVAHAPIWR